MAKTFEIILVTGTPVKVEHEGSKLTITSQAVIVNGVCRALAHDKPYCGITPDIIHQMSPAWALRLFERLYEDYRAGGYDEFVIHRLKTETELTKLAISDIVDAAKAGKQAV